MNKKLVIKIGIDIGMTICLLLLMSYSLLGETAHEWIGILMFFLFLLHHFMNRKWIFAITKGAYSVQRWIQTVLFAAMLLLMAGSMVSGIILSEHIFHFEKPFIVSDMARQVHMFCAYWGMILMSAHIGMHWSVIVVMCGRLFSKNSILRQWICKLLAFGIAFFGAYAFQKRQIANYLLMKNHFLFLNPTDTIGIFLLDYLAVMSCVIWLIYYISCLFKRKGKKL